jgi:S1-C subfamily serine protease
MSFYGGYLITHVEKGGPGSTAGLIAGSVIQRVDDKQPESLVAFAKDILAHSAGDTVRLSVVWEIRRGGFLQRRAGLAKVKVQ